MIAKTSLGFKGLVVVGTISVASVGANIAYKSAHPLADFPFDTFTVEFGTTATSSAVAVPINVQDANTGEVYSAPAPAQGYYIGRLITDVRGGDNT